jgi:4-amino-4-deoxy-L-arabinose transferase-like glycosyltransferase
MNYCTKLFLLILTASVIRLLFSSATQLGNVEVYYWSWSLKPQWNYVDHPPVVAWMIWLTTLNQWLVSEFTVRLGAVLCSSMATWLIFKIGKTLRDERTGWIAAFCYTSCVYSSIAIGIFVLPDSPQIVFWLASLLLALKLNSPDKLDNKSNRRYWLIFGLASGLCIMCKVHGAFIWLGMILYLMFNDCSQFKRPGIYLAGLITLIVISPIFYWNIEHHWYTWKFQSTRFTVDGNKPNVIRFGKQLIEVFFTVGPIHFVIIWQAVVMYFRRKFADIGKQVQLLLFCNLPLILFLLVVSLFRETYAHWPGPAYVGLLVFPALTFTNKSAKKDGALPGILKWALGYCTMIACLQILVINYFPGTSSIYKEGIEVGKGDVTVDMFGWKEVGQRFQLLYQDDLKSGRIKKGSPIVITNWTPGAAIEFYIAHTTGQPVLGAAGLDSLHQYYWMNQYKKPLRRGDDAYYIVPSNYFDLKAIDGITKHFATAATALSLPVYRSNRLCREFHIIRLLNYDGLPFR